MPTATSFSWTFSWAQLVGGFNAFIGMLNTPIALAGSLILVFAIVFFVVGNYQGGRRGQGGIFSFRRRSHGKHGDLLDYDDWLTVNDASRLYGVPKSTVRSNALYGYFGFPSGIQNSVMHKGKWRMMEDPHFIRWHKSRNRVHD